MFGSRVLKRAGRTLFPTRVFAQTLTTLVLVALPYTALSQTQNQLVLDHQISRDGHAFFLNETTASEQ